jgi:hypothetical protein
MNNRAAGWFARLAVGAVFIMNVACAVVFILQPQDYAAGFELSGVVGRIIVQSLGILFLMWNVTYPPVILQPEGHRTLFGIVLAQQAIGVVGETWLWLSLPAGHTVLRLTGLRFMLFDGLGLVLMGAAYLWLLRNKP